MTTQLYRRESHTRPKAGSHPDEPYDVMEEVYGKTPQPRKRRRTTYSSDGAETPADDGIVALVPSLRNNYVVNPIPRSVATSYNSELTQLRRSRVRRQPVPPEKHRRHRAHYALMAWEQALGAGRVYYAFNLTYRPTVRPQAGHITQAMEKYAKHHAVFRYNLSYSDCAIAWTAEGTPEGSLKYRVVVAVEEGETVLPPDVRWPGSQHPAWRQGPGEAFQKVEEGKVKALLAAMANGITDHPAPKGTRRCWVSVGWGGRQAREAEVRRGRWPEWILEETRECDKVEKVTGGIWVWRYDEALGRHAEEKVFIPTPYENRWSKEARWRERRDLCAAARRKAQATERAREISDPVAATFEVGGETRKGDWRKTSSNSSRGQGRVASANFSGERAINLSRRSITNANTRRKVA